MPSLNAGRAASATAAPDNFNHEQAMNIYTAISLILSGVGFLSLMAARIWKLDSSVSLFSVGVFAVACIFAAIGIFHDIQNLKP